MGLRFGLMYIPTFWTLQMFMQFHVIIFFPQIVALCLSPSDSEFNTPALFQIPSVRLSPQLAMSEDPPTALAFCPLSCPTPPLLLVSDALADLVSCPHYYLVPAFFLCLQSYAHYLSSAPMCAPPTVCPLLKLSDIMPLRPHNSYLKTPTFIFISPAPNTLLPKAPNTRLC